MNDFQQALSTRDEILAELLRREIADMAMQSGVNSYEQGQQGLARQQWMAAVQAQPNQVAAYYMIGRADMDLSNWQEASDFFRRVLPQTNSAQIRAAATASLGDCFYRAGNIGQARQDYLRALVIEPDLNYRTLKSLSEYYYR